MKLVQSRSNPQLKALLRLAASSRERRSSGTTLLEGERLIRAYADSGGIAEALLAAESALARREIAALFDTARAKSRLVIADRLSAQISELVSHSGIAAVVRVPAPGPAPAADASRLLLESVQDPGNLGSILRSAVAAGIGHVFLSRGSVFAWSPKVVRAGMGAHFFLSIFENADLADAVRGFGGCVAAMDAGAPNSLYDLDLHGPVAWVFGNEGAGLTEAAMRIAHRRVRIPMPGPSESLNVAAAAAICLFEQVRQKAR
jgi:TrmH family RNA methyltransferase